MIDSLYEWCEHIEIPNDITDSAMKEAIRKCITRKTFTTFINMFPDTYYTENCSYNIGHYDVCE